MLTQEPLTKPRRRLRGLWSSLLVALVLVVVGVAVFQPKPVEIPPLGWGSTGNDAELYPGLPAGEGIHPVNTFGGLHDDIYIPPQAGAFSLFVDIRNNGSRAVVIESVRLPRHASIWAVAPVRYSRPPGGNGAVIPPPTSRVLHDVRLGPGQEIYVGIPVRTTRCGLTDFWADVAEVYVTYQFQSSSHTVAMPWTDRGGALILHGPGQPGQQDAICAQ
jgi:hypothetical protein